VRNRETVQRSYELGNVVFEVLTEVVMNSTYYSLESNAVKSVES
jgi:hypothetical protein